METRARQVPKDAGDLIEQQKRRIAEWERAYLSALEDLQVAEENARRLARRIVELERAGIELVREGDTAIYPKRPAFWEKAKARWLSSTAELKTTPNGEARGTIVPRQ